MSASRPTPRRTAVELVLLRRRLVTSAVFVAGAMLAVVDTRSFRPQVILLELLAAVFLFAAFFEGPLASPVAAMCAAALPPMLGNHRIAFGAVASCLIAFGVGELLTGCREARLASSKSGLAPVAPGALLTGAVGVGVAVVVMTAASMLPHARVWSMTVVGALALFAVVVRRQRHALRPDLPPPPMPTAEARFG
jgi:hypothetical protein